MVPVPVSSPSVLEAQVAASKQVPWATVPLSMVSTGLRRLEASTYLRDGFGLRQRLSQAPVGVQAMAELAEIWQPARLKGFTVTEGRGFPFLSAGQVFEAKPRVRKWLSAAMTSAPESRVVKADWLLLSCSGVVGRVTAVYPEHLEKIITHDLLRIVPKDRSLYGWLYAYLKTPTFMAIAGATEYGHMIKHLEAEHVLRMPVAMPRKSARDHVSKMAESALDLRRQSRVLQEQADACYAKTVNPENEVIEDDHIGVVRSSYIAGGRRRLEAQYHRPMAQQITELVHASATRGVERLDDLVHSIRLGARFKRFFGEKGTPYRSASELFDVNPPVQKRVLSALLADPDSYFLEPGTMVMACSGQTYGLLGRTMTLTENHAGTFGSHDLIRIVPDSARARAGYLQTVLNHPEYGRPLVIRHASGTSIPHLDPVDIREVPIPRFDPAVENEIADLAEEATALGAEADRLETEAVKEAEALVEEIAGQH